MDARYLREGIGTDLYWDGLPAAAQLQDVYLTNFCGEALSKTARSLDPATCDGLSLTPRDWGLLVQAGMNDIDLRCDAYLSWLYDRKSSKEPFLKELASLGGSTAGILRATNAGQTPIALAAIAFGIAADAFTNLDLRLVNAVDYTTVNSVVRGNRTRFRFNNIDLVIDNRPAAVYVLRNYLSICVPDSIEMSINSTLNVFHSGGPDALRDLPIGLRNPAATSATSAAVRGMVTAQQTITRPNGPPPIEHPEFTAILDPYNPKTQDAGLVRSIQEMLCVTNGEIGVKRFDDTVALIKIYQATKAATNPSVEITGKLNDSKQIGEVIASGRCAKDQATGRPTGPQNFFEKLTFKSNSRGMQNLANFITALNAVPGGTQKVTGQTLDSARARIKEVRGLPSISKQLSLDMPDDLAGQVTPDLFLAVK